MRRKEKKIIDEQTPGTRVLGALLYGMAVENTLLICVFKCDMILVEDLFFVVLTMSIMKTEQAEKYG